MAWEIWLTPTLSGFVGDFFELAEESCLKESYIWTSLQIFSYDSSCHPDTNFNTVWKNVQITVTTRKNFALTKFLHSNFVSGGMLAASPDSKNWLWTFFYLIRKYLELIKVWFGSLQEAKRVVHDLMLNKYWFSARRVLYVHLYFWKNWILSALLGPELFYP